jgi:hypothetical protein
MRGGDAGFTMPLKIRFRPKNIYPQGLLVNVKLYRYPAQVPIPVRRSKSLKETRTPTA